MSISILLPALSPSMESGNIVRWLKKEGDEVRLGDVIAEIETDKATMEIEAFDEGVLSRIVRPDGSREILVNDVIGILAARGEKIPEPHGMSDHAGRIQATEFASGPGEAVQAVTRPDRAWASPLAKRIARQKHVDLSGLVGSGPLGRIVRRDVDAKAMEKASAPALPAGSGTVTLPRPEASDAARISGMFEPGIYEEIELDGMRRTIAARLVEAKRTVPHFYLSANCDADALAGLRNELSTAAKAPLTFNDCLVKALALAMQAVPEANVIWAGDKILQFRHSDIAVAIAVEGGLYTPVVRRAEAKSLSAISMEIKDLAGRARAGKLTPQEYAGGSASISNLGMYGVSNFQPIINPPHAFILGVGAVEERLASRNGQPISVRAFTVTMSCDHRAVDGALAARLLAEFKGIVEKPMRILV